MKISETLRELMSMKPAQHQQQQQQREDSIVATDLRTTNGSGSCSGTSNGSGAKTRNKKLPIWSDSAERAVIDFYRERPFLWDQKAVDYYNKERKDATLVELATKLGVRYTASAIRERWSNMRCTFMVNERKIAKAKMGNGHLSNFVPTWPHYNDLKFLQTSHPKCPKSTNGRKKFLEDGDQLSKQKSRKRKILDSFQDEMANYYYTTSEDDVESVSGSSLNPAVISTTTPSGANSNTQASWIKVESGSGSATPALTPTPPPLMPEYHMYEPQYQNDRNLLMAESMEVFKEFVLNSTKNQDCCQAFGAVVAAALREMPSYHRARAELEIQQVLLKYNPANPENLSKTDAMENE